MEKSKLVIGKVYNIDYREGDVGSHYVGRWRLTEIDPRGFNEGTAQFDLLDEPPESGFLEGIFQLTSIVSKVPEQPSTRIVICSNDYPHALLPEGSTEEQAVAKCKELQDCDPRNRNDSIQVFYLWYEIPEIEA